jgi:hypothetical protein
MRTHLRRTEVTTWRVTGETMPMSLARIDRTGPTLPGIFE